jgi:hypothetical protein
MLTGNASRVAAQGGTIVSHAPARAHWTVRFARDVAILSGPSIAVVVTLAIAWEMRGTPLTMFDGILSPRGVPELYPSTWLTLGHAIVPVIFLIANLVNRRYGDNYAIAHILARGADRADDRGRPAARHASAADGRRRTGLWLPPPSSAR